MKKLFKIFAWVVGIFVVLILIAAVALELFFPVEKAKQMIVERGSAALGRPISVGEVDVSLWGGLGVVLDSVVISNPPDWPTDSPMLTAHSVDVKLRILPLISGEYRLSRLIIDQPVIALHKLETGEDNYTFPVTDTSQATQAMPSETRSAALAVSLDELRIDDGNLTYVDDSAGTSVTLNRMNLSTSLANPRPSAFASEGHLEVGEMIAITKDTIPTVALDLRYSADYDMASKNLLLKNADLRVNQFNFNMSGELNHGGDAMTARGHVRSNEIAVRDLFSLLPPTQRALLDGYRIEGDFALNADLEYDGAQEDALNYSGNAAISSMLLEYQKIPGQLRIGNALVDFKRDNVRLNIQDGSFNDKPLKGYVQVENFDAPLVNAELAGEINLALVQPFLPADSGQELSGDAVFAVKAIGPVKQVDSLDVSGTLKVTNGRYTSSKVPEPVESFTVDAYFDNHLVRVNTFDARMPSGNLSFSGRINELIPYLMADSATPPSVNPSIDGNLAGTMNLAMLNPFLPEEGKPEIAGKMAMDLALAGDVIEPSGLRVRGTVNITDGVYRDSTLAENVEHFATKMTIIPDTIRIEQLTAQFETSDMNLTGTLTKPFPYLLPLKSVDRDKLEKPFLTFQMTSNRFNVDSLFPETSPTATEGGIGVAAGDTVPPFILPNIDGRGTAAMDTVIYMDVEFTDLTGDVVIRNRVVSATNVKGKVYTGDITGETSVDFNNWELPVYDGKFAASNIEVNDFAERFTKFGGFVHGKFNFDGNYEAVGWEPDALLNSLTMDGDARMRNGRLQTEGAIYSGLQKIGQLVNQQIDKSQELKDAQAKIRVADGQVFFDKLTTGLGNLGDLEVTGSYSFEGDLSYNGTILLSESMTGKILSKDVIGDVAGLLGGGQSVKRLRLPLTIGGTMSDPQVEINFQSIAEQAGKGAAEGLTNKIKDLFKR